ncbi:MAG: hypothetical protein D6690_17680 [Nitrospirae bacterium]|nr:MAG: hypothetical protein D6690_17680 [Nitrospirota bacterium]
MNAPAHYPRTQHPRVRRFAAVITIVLIVFCNGLLFLGLWISGIDLEVALNAPEFYDPQSGYCVRTGWATVVGRDRPMQVCVEWLELDDPSGNTHRMRQGQPLVVSDTGQWRYQSQPEEDRRLLFLLVFIVMVIGGGIWTKHALITRYQRYIRGSDRRHYE